MTISITANELKTRGVSALEPILKDQEMALISVRGKNVYVVMAMKQYNYLRECELEAALAETRHDIKNNNVFQDNIEEHIKRISSEL